MTTQSFYLHLFNSLPSCNFKRLKKIYDHFPDLKTFWEKCQPADLINLQFSPKTAGQIINEKKSINPHREYDFLQKKKINLLSLNDNFYPMLLKEIYDPPALLYYRGTFPATEERCLAIVGSRFATSYGRQVAEDFASKLSQNGLSIVSGLALGIDSCAHRSALNSKQRTIAVLGSGINFIYPPENKKLAEEITENGLLISEFLPDKEPEPYFFPLRNRIISGLSLGTLVVEAKQKSGALVTAELAISQNRDLFAVPGSIYNKNSYGPNKLIQGSQAYPVLCPEDILEKLKITPLADPQLFKEIIFASETEKNIYNLLLSPIHIDQIIQQTGLPASVINSTLSLMEIKGLIKESEGKIYFRI